MKQPSRTTSPEAQRHADWLGMLQPEGLVVSIAVLEEQGVYVRQSPSIQETFASLCLEDQIPHRDAFLQVAIKVLEWPEKYLLRTAEAVLSWQLDLPDLGATLRPDAVLTDPKGTPLLFVLWCDSNPDAPRTDARWPASLQERFERLLTERQAVGDRTRSPSNPSSASPRSGPPIGVLAWPDGIRLTYAPAGEAPGNLTFPLEALLTVDGRLLIDALVMLLGKHALFTAPQDARLLSLLEQSRKRQEKVTTALASQVEEALALLVAGMDTANQRSGGALFRGLSDDGPSSDSDHNPLYRGLITLLLRMVFLLYAEDRNLLPMDHPLYANHYSLSGLADRLQSDRLRHPQAMDRRFGAWARLLALFRLVYSGAHAPAKGDEAGENRPLIVPPREGELFDPDAYPFLEGRLPGSSWTSDPAAVPPIDDGVVEAVLTRLVHLEGQRLSYRNLDVEQIGSVYESLMGFTLNVARGTAIALRPEGRVIDLAELRDADDPVRFLSKITGLKGDEIREKLSLDATSSPHSDTDWLRLLEPLRPRNGRLFSPGEHYLQPGEERRRTGSHYTPRSLTERIVRRTLDPVLFGHTTGGHTTGGHSRDGNTGEKVPTSAQLLALKVCDPAMGSGAFLAEACRYLSARLVDAWSREGSFPPETRGTDPLLVARRLVAEHCLFGVDKNPFAVNLARLSLWLITLARDLPFTFVDHALKQGDSVIGLSFEAIVEAFALKGAQTLLFPVDQVLTQAARTRAEILKKDDYRHKRRFLDEAESDVARERALGDLLLAHHWAGGKQKEQKERLAWLMRDSQRWYFNRKPVASMTSNLSQLRAELPMRPFHWHLEFPEVFTRENPGFDAVVGNPPFAGKNTVIAQSGERYIALFQVLHPHAHGNSDLAAYFFLRTGEILRNDGCFGLVSTNTIKQGDTRATGLQYMISHGTTIFGAELDLPWSGEAAVMVDVVHGCRGTPLGVRPINSSLLLEDEVVNPEPMRDHAGKSFIGSYILGMGFTLSVEQGETLRAKVPGSQSIIKPYIGGQEINTNKADSYGYVYYDRFVIDFGNRSLQEAEEWPDLLDIVRQKVKPERDQNNREARRIYWWKFGERAPGLYAAISSMSRCLVAARVSKHLLISFQPTDRVFAETLCAFMYSDYLHFALLQSRVHEHWARTMGSSMKTDLRYTPSTCFDTFPFPRPTEVQREVLERTGEALYRKRTEIMVSSQQGMTKVWNRVVDEDCIDGEILELRRVRDELDAAVLDAYGWGEVAPTDREELVRRLRVLNRDRAAEEAGGKSS